MTVLHLDSSILGANSVSRTVSAAVVERLAAEHPGTAIVRRDLAADPLPHLTLADLPAVHPLSVASDGSSGDAVLAEFLEADTVVIGVPMYNFGIPSQLKAWFDRILVPGVTFSYGANGPEGLVGDKRVILTLSRGGVFQPGAASEHAESHLRSILGFIGITPEIVIAEGVGYGPEARQAALDGALDEAVRLAA